MDRIPISPGFYECTSTVSSPRPVDMPGVGHMILAPKDPCDHRYQEGSGQPVGGEICDCETFAVGRCARCRRPVCGDHSRLHDGKRVCVTCLESTARTAEEAQRAWDEERLGRLAAIRDPVERLVSSMRYLRDWYVDLELRKVRSPTKTNPFDIGAHLARKNGLSDFNHQYLNKVRDICPDVKLAGSRLPIDSTDRWKYPWDSGAIGRWFVGKVRAAGVAPTGSSTPEPRRFRRSVPEPVWRFEKGSVKQASSRGSFWTPDGIITLAGETPDGLNHFALAEIGEILGLPSWHAERLP